jgi:hypothetical protein
MADDSIHVILHICFSTECFATVKACIPFLVCVHDEMQMVLRFHAINPLAAFMGAYETKLSLIVEG